MKILFLTHSPPYPVHSGAAIRTLNLMRALAAEHELHLLSLSDEQPKQVMDRLEDSPLSRICQTVRVVAIPRRTPSQRLLTYVATRVSKKPWMVAEYYNQDMDIAVSDTILSQSIECVHAELLNMTQYLPLSDPRVKCVYGSHNVEFQLYQQRAPFMKNPLTRAYCLFEGVLTRQYENSIVRKADVTIAVTSQDKARYLKWNKDASVTHFPITCDPDEWPPTTLFTDEPTILFVGTLYWFPNVDGISWFVNEILPAVRKRFPKVLLDVVGRDPPPVIRDLCDKTESLRLHPSVPDTTPYFRKNAIFIVPLRIGGGMRVKILEAMARKLPIVSTSLGAEGIELEPGNQAMIADSADTFAQAINSLLESPEKRDTLVQNAYALLLQKFSWKNTTNDLLELYNRVLSCPP